MEASDTLTLKDRLAGRVARFADRREDWTVFGFETARDPRFARAQRRYLGASGSARRHPGERVYDVDPVDARRQPHPDALPRDRRGFLHS
jgi:hypothetical protein